MRTAILLASIWAFQGPAPDRADTAFERLDDDEDGRLSRDELAMIAKTRFDELDLDDDGFLAREEFREMTLPGDPEAILQRLDDDGDGRLVEDELPIRLRERFAELDANDDGSLDADELRRLAIRRRESRAGGMMRQLMELDADGDGRLHRDELPEAMEYLRESFDRFDLDGDGYLDGTELRVMTEQPWWRRP